MKRNPPTKGYKHFGVGAFSSAFRKKKRVELIIKPTTWTHKDGTVRYDMSRELLIMARDRVSESAKKHLPDIKRERIDICDSGDEFSGIEIEHQAEIVYSMPYYDDVSDRANDQLRAIRIPWIPTEPEKFPPSLIEAYTELQELARDYGAIFDLTKHNCSESEDGDLIFRDPFFLAETGYQSIKLSKLWPEDQFRIFDRLMYHYAEYSSI
jgi:hypothetical protein